MVEFTLASKVAFPIHMIHTELLGLMAELTLIPSLASSPFIVQTNLACVGFRLYSEPRHGGELLGIH